MNDPINPAYYKRGQVECIDAIEAATEGLSGREAVCTGNAIKYLWRWKEKGGHEDLKKAIWYISRIIGEERVAETLAMEAATMIANLRERLDKYEAAYKTICELLDEEIPEGECSEEFILGFQAGLESALESLDPLQSDGT